MKKKKYKLKYSLYCDEDYECLDTCKLDDDYILFAKKGLIAERFELTEEVREEYCVYDKEYKTLYLFKNGNYLLSQADYSEDFEEVT